MNDQSTSLEPHQRPLGRALKEAGKAVGCAALTALLVLVPVVCVGIVAVDLAASRVAYVELELRSLEKALREHHRRTGRLPGPVDGLGVLVDEGLWTKPPLDPWGNPYTYSAQDGAVELGSLGEDGARGGEEEDQDTVYRFRLTVDSGT